MEYSNKSEYGKIELIGEVLFMDEPVKIYYNQGTSEYVSWQARNPDSFYQGIVYLNNEGKISYPEDAVIPPQTQKDKEMIPKFVITSQPKIDDILLTRLNEYLKINYKLRNNII